MTIRDELLELQQKDGVLQPERAVEWAKNNPDSSLYAALDWNNENAAHNHRLWQVRQLIAVHVINKRGERQLVSLTIDRSALHGGYRHIDDVLKAPDLRQVLLNDALSELERMKAKYTGLLELVRVWDEIEAARLAQLAPPKTSRRRRGKGGDRPSAQA